MFKTQQWKNFGRRGSIWAGLALLLGGTSTAMAYVEPPGPGLFWYNPSSGAMDIWWLNPADPTQVTHGVITGRNCNSTCASFGWTVLGTGTFGMTETFSYESGVLLYNAPTGILEYATFDGNGQVSGTYDLSWTCDQICAQQWKFAAIVDIDGNGFSDVLWRNVSTGELSAWVIEPNGVVTGSRSYSWHCDATCAATWTPISGTPGFFGDLFWYNGSTGQISDWVTPLARAADDPAPYYPGTGVVLGQSTLSWTCGLSNGCAQSGWRPVGLGDFNLDGSPDVLWYNPNTGQLGPWFTASDGIAPYPLPTPISYHYRTAPPSLLPIPSSWNVTGSSLLTWPYPYSDLCDYRSGCASQWRFIGTLGYNWW